MKNSNPIVLIETIGTAEAREMLSMNTGNFRPIDIKRVTAYAKEMASGNWELTGDTIKITKNELMDGQHRLYAIIESGVTIRTAVAYNVAKNALFVDRNKPRTNGQWLHYRGMKNANNMASAARFCVQHDMGLWDRTTAGVDEILTSEIVNYAIKHEDSLSKAVNLARKGKGLIVQSYWAAILHIGTGRTGDPEENNIAKWFVDGVVSGANLAEGDPPLALRNRLVGEKTSQVKSTAYYLRMLASVAWNKAVRGEEITKSALRIRFAGPTKQKPPKIILVADDD